MIRSVMQTRKQADPKTLIGHGKLKDLYLMALQEAATLCPPVFSQYAIAAYLDQFDWRAQISTFCDMYRQRRDAYSQ